MIKYEDEPIYAGEGYVRVTYDPNLAGSLTFSVSDLPPGISYDPTTGEFRGAALRSAVPRNGSPVTYNATITVPDGNETESAIVPFTILDNTFSIETPGTQVSHPGDTVFFAPTLSYTQQNFSGSLMFSQENLPSGLSFDSLYGTVQGTIDQDVATPESNIRDYTVVLTVTDWVTGDRQEISFQWRVETDPYPAYIVHVEEANAIYVSAVQQALDERDSAWQTAVANAQADVDAAHQRYLTELSSVREQYNSAVEQAQQAFQRAVAEAESQRDAAIAAAEATLKDYIAPYEAQYEEAVAAAQSRYQAAIAQADQEYLDYIAPYLQARDNAYQYWQEHPDDTEAWQAYQDAEQQYLNALSVAENNRQAAYDAAQNQLD